MSRISERFWSEALWLPENTTWSDVANGPEKSIVYTDTKDFLYVFPLGVMIVLTRFVLDRYFLVPLGKSLHIEDKRPRKAPPNANLEAAYLSSKKPNFLILAKQLGITERQVERWWRLRCNQDKPSKIYKFCECSWKVVFYTGATAYGLYVLWDKEWLWTLIKCYDGFPHQGVTEDIKWYYMFQTAYAWCLLIFQFRAVKRKDSWQMYVHHVATIFLLSISWICNLYRIGSLVLLLHDCGDILLETGKALKYARYHTTCTYVFVVFMIIWIVTRIVVFPVYIIPLNSEYVRTVAVYYVLKTLCWMLFCLHLLWTWYILQVAYKALKVGEVEGDVRSSESESEISNHTD